MGSIKHEIGIRMYFLPSMQPSAFVYPSGQGFGGSQQAGKTAETAEADECAAFC